uniref:Mycothiol S-conjugate amidase n=1 Tax=Thermosporothrix sp. COM3 TaxID=2490863 RepID=A0A455STW9_9CHLR|nr:hypothetical protein KTC_52900 [Thermosporothrix sp. COM3]
MSAKRLLGVFAHPDDEGMIGGALLHYAHEGVETGLAYATRGEVGEVADPLLTAPANMGEIREQEMREAAEMLNVKHLWFLGFRDSGMAGVEANHHPLALLNARRADVIGRLVKVIREFQPQVLITFDETGWYGSPDHILMYRYATSAFHAAADGALYPELGPAHAVSKLYYCAFARRQIRMIEDWLEGQDFEGAFKGLDPSKLGMTDEQISVVLDVEQWSDRKEWAMSRHRTLVNPSSPFAQIPPELQRRWRATEYYQLATSRVGEDVVGENDLFARVP